MKKFYKIVTFVIVTITVAISLYTCYPGEATINFKILISTVLYGHYLNNFQR